MTFSELQVGKTYTWKKPPFITDFKPDENDRQCTYTVTRKYQSGDILAIENHPHNGRNETRWAFAYADWEEVNIGQKDVELLI